jgi:outer membrane pore protein F/outer membrane protein N
MKRKILAVVIPALLATQAAQSAEIYSKDGNSVDLYGKVEGKYVISDNATFKGNHSLARIGFKGESAINDQVAGYGQWEYQASLSVPEKGGRSADKSTANTRLGFAGIKWGNGNSLDYGRNYGVLHDISRWTDVLPAFGGDTVSHNDNYMSGRTSNVVTYRNKNFFNNVSGWNFAVQYQGTNGNKSVNWDGQDRKFENQNGDGVGFSTTYDVGYGLSMGAAYTHSNRTDESINNGKILYSNVSNHGKQAYAYSAGLKYDANDLYLAAMSSVTYNMTPYGEQGSAGKSENYEVVAQYNYAGFRPSIAYLRSDGDYLNTNYGDEQPKKDGKQHQLLNYVDVGTSYNFNKNMSAYIDYKVNLVRKNDQEQHNKFLKDTKIETGNQVAIGISYEF